MESVIRGLVLYVFVFLVFRIAGKRTLSKATTFDLVLLLIISETTQQAMVVENHSMTNAALLIFTLVGTDILFSLLKHWIPALDPVLDGTAVVLVKDGQPLAEPLNRERVDPGDILEAARCQRGLENMDQIKLAVLERNGEISVIPRH
jgi:uncharacterized membrane protein YcaP (DUF421 family)